jgi:hypothetical protein
LIRRFAGEFAFVFKDSKRREIIGKLGEAGRREKVAEEKGLRGDGRNYFGGGGLTRVVVPFVSSLGVRLLSFAPTGLGDLHDCDPRTAPSASLGLVLG